MSNWAFLTGAGHWPAFDAKHSPIFVPLADEARRFAQRRLPAEGAGLIDGHIEMRAPREDLPIVVIIHKD